MRIELEWTRAGTITHHTVEVPRGAAIRLALRSIGQAAEGCAVLVGDQPIPLDTPVVDGGRYTVLPTFSGG